jgi:uncharacterized protein YjiS (DUF1127 family)
VSNRLIQLGRVPLIPDPLVALQASSAFSNSQSQTNQVIAIGQSISGLWHAITGCAKAIDNALQIRRISSMDDRLLSDMGLRRDQIPGLFIDRRVDHLDLPYRGRGSGAL